MSATKTVMTISSVAMALLFGGGVYLFMNFGSVAKHVTERIAGQTLGVKVQIVRMDVSLQDKTVAVNGLRIGNPSGFKNPYAVTAGSISIALDSLSKELIYFKDIAVTDMHINLEVQEGGTNLSAIKNQIKTKPREAEDAEATEQVKVIIDRLAIPQAQLNPSVVLLSEQDLKAVTVSDIILTGIGRKENGVLAREAIAQIWSTIALQANKSASSAGFYQGMDPEALKALGTSQIQQLKDQISDEAESLGAAIESLFNE